MTTIREAIDSSIQELSSDGPEPAQETSPAVDSAETTEAVEPDLATPAEMSSDAETASTASVAAAAARDELGRFAPKPPAAKTAPGSTTNGVKPQPPGTPAQGIPKPPPPPPTLNTAAAKAPPVAEAIKAPQAWKPAARDKWATLPPEVQQEVLRVERDVKASIAEAAEARKHHTAFRETITPFEGMLRAEGVEPMAAVGNLLSTAMALRTGAPPQKAAILANIIRAYDVPIQDLDRELSGEGAQQAAQQNAPPANYADPRVDQLFQHLQTMNEQRQQAEINSFAQSHEFFADVKTEMDDIRELNRLRGVTQSLEEVYARACKMNESVSSYIQQREAAKAANANTASTQRARNAASSVRSQPANATNGAHKPGSIRDAMMQSVQELSGR